MALSQSFEQPAWVNGCPERVLERVRREGRDGPLWLFSFLLLHNGWNLGGHLGQRSGSHVFRKSEKQEVRSGPQHLDCLPSL